MRLAHLMLVVAILAVHSTATVFVTGQTAKPSDTNNQPATPPPPPPPAGPTPPPPGQTPPPKPPGQTPPPLATVAGQTPQPPLPPGQTLPPNPNPTPAATPAPSPPSSPSPSPTTAAPTTVAPVATVSSANTNAPAASSSSSSSSSAAPSTSLPIVNTSASDTSDSGMSAGIVILIVLAALAVVGVVGFFVVRHLRARTNNNDHDSNNKHFDYPIATTSPHEVTVLGSQNATSDYALAHMERQSSQSSHDVPIMAAANGSVLSSITSSSFASTGNNNLQSAPYYNTGTTGTTAHPNHSNVTLYSTTAVPTSPSFAKSTSKFLHGPDAESPPFQKTDNQLLSRPSSVLPDDEEPMEFNHSFAESYAAGSYSESMSSVSSYSDRGYMSSFVQGMPGSDGLSVGASSAMGDALEEDDDRETAAQQQQENAHWLDAMRDTGDSYAMLEADAYGSERGSAMSSRFSTDSEFNDRSSQL